MNRNQDQNSHSTPSGHPSQTELASPDTNPKSQPSSPVTTANDRPPKGATGGRHFYDKPDAATIPFSRPLPAQEWVRGLRYEDQCNLFAYMLDKITLGDCQTVLRALPDACADFILTDPPYAVGYTDRSGRKILNDDNTRWMFPAFSELYRVLKPDSYAVSFYGWGKADRFLAVWRECGFRPVGHFVWVKRYASCVRATQMKHEQAYLLAKGNPVAPKSPPADVQPWHYTGNRLHPTQKPISSLVPLIDAYTPVNGIVLDPFAGSGSTGLAVRQCRRRFLLIEKDAAYFHAAQKRLQLTTSRLSL